MISARILPSPGVVISSARHANGSCPITSCAPDTLDPYRPVVTPTPEPGAPLVFDANAGAQGNITPPGRSRLPVSVLITSINQQTTDAWSWKHVPSLP